jgi:hypothetical protein
MHFDKLSSMQRPLRHQSRGSPRFLEDFLRDRQLRQPHIGPKRRLQLPFGHHAAPHALAACKKRGFPHRCGASSDVGFWLCTDCLKTLLLATPVPCAIVQRLACCTVCLHGSGGPTKLVAEVSVDCTECTPACSTALTHLQLKSSLPPASPRNIVTRKADNVRLLAVARQILLHSLLVVVNRSEIRI